ncbi:conserved protein of unknown function [Nitrospira japonica]|uniref:DarT domain-containing protein n=1 Tax=Nitrospira japonica TaxID=1325564 RepID=A0A1W1I7G4_9BACT|nr:hypothetical protein [Nitrospira japonica]SLM48925.1 conserved protein of unknown function [Nitrospira japonica]
MARRLPRHVYHLAEAANWPSIQRYGLLPAQVLVDRSGIKGRERAHLLGEQRKRHVVLAGGYELRDQRPMPPEALARCLVGMTPADWYRLINAHVYFWPDHARLNRQRTACGVRPQVVLVVDAESLVARYGSRTVLTPINSGHARRRPAVRGAATFVPYEAWLADGWASEAAALQQKTRSSSHRPAELAVEGPILDMTRYLVRVVELAGDRPFVPA